MKVIYKTATHSTRGKDLSLIWGIHDSHIGDSLGSKLLIAMSDEGLCWVGINCGVTVLKKNWAGAEFHEDKKKTASIAKKLIVSWKADTDKLDMPLVLYGTKFQQKVWRQLLKIKYGKTVTYQDIAKKVGSPAAVRAVGSAVGKNPVSILVPCHRVVNKTGNRINYGWGADVKIALLKAEGVA